MTAAAELDEQVCQLIEAGELGQAAQLCNQLNAQYAHYATGWFTASRLALLAGKPDISIEAIDRALSLEPGRPDWLLQRLACMWKAGDETGALALARHLAPHRFDSAPLASRLGNLLARLGLYDQALLHCERAVELEPGNSLYRFRLAAVLRFTGDVDKALGAIRECIQLDPDHAEAYLLRSGLRTATAEANDVAALEAVYARSAEDSAGRLRVCYALARELDDLGDYGRSFNFLAEGSALRRRQFDYGIADDLATIQAIQSTIGAEQIARSPLGHVNAEPIFVVGMPRTGTALVQRILSAHPVVRPTNRQLRFAVELLDRCGQLPGPKAGTAAELLTRAPLIDFAALGEAYVEAVRPIGENRAHFVDSMPLNFLYAGMIHMALPKARIVVLRRNPMDSCYAAYRTLFGQTYPFSYDLNELGEYFVAFHSLTSHWLELMSDTVHAVSYEELVTDPRPVIERLLEYCSLSFEESCLGFFDDDSASQSAGAERMRRAFSRASIGVWRNYEEQLQPVARILRKAGIPID